MLSRPLAYLAALPAAALIAAAGLPAAAAPTYAETGQVAGPDGGWDYASFDPVHRRLFISRSNGLTALDVDSGALIGHLADGQRTHEPLVLPGGDAVLLTNGGGGNALLLNAADGKLIAAIPTAPFPDGATYDPDSGFAVTTSGTGTATILDPVAKTEVGTIAVGGGLEFPAADGRGHVFINIESANQIAVLDVKAKTVTARYALTGCDGPSGLAYAPDADVLVAACSNNVAVVVAAKTGAVVATLPIGKGPDSTLYDPARKLIFIPCGRDGVLEVIDVGSGPDAKVIQTVKTELGARTGAVDPKTGKIYLPAASYGPPPAGRKRCLGPSTSWWFRRRLKSHWRPHPAEVASAGSVRWGMGGRSCVC